ncbi:MAG: lysophospholipid acyltransferase family protein [Inquilinaceae bacterium]
MGSHLLSLRRLALYLLWTGALIPIQAVAVALRLPLRDRLPRLYHRVCCRLIGLDIAVRGTSSAARPTLFVSNHSSYMDIMVLGALISGSFVAKTEVAGWPLFGLLAKLQRTVFVDRRIGTTQHQRGSLEARLAAGDNLILFPEGTSSDGNRTLPFKSALFAVAGLDTGTAPLTVQPVSISCTALDGIPLGRRLRSVYAWYGDMDMLSHLWSMIGLGRLTVVVHFHAPVTLAAAGTRKALADRCWHAVAGGVADANAGRASAPVAA